MRLKLPRLTKLTELFGNPRARNAVARKAAVIAAAVIAALVAWALWRALAREGFEAADKTPTIFVSIASYRDIDCHMTLQSLFANAADPARVHVGVCEQNTKAGAEACMPPDFEWHDNVRRISLPHKEARGPTYARYLCSTLYRGETYFCQVDSHTRFTKGWDARAIAMLKACPSLKPVLSHYPHDWEESGKGTAAAGVPVLCKSMFNNEGMLTFNAVTLPASTTPKPVPFTSGGFVFGPGSMVREVPYDPDLPHLFTGEEILYSARLWTSGYDFFTPTDNLVYHHYYRNEAAKFWDDLDYTAQQNATLAKVKAILAGAMPKYRYGMGSARPLEDYWAFAGVDWASQTSASEAAFCK